MSVVEFPVRAPEQRQPAWARFTREEIDLIKRTVAQGATDDELKLLLYLAVRYGLDPFAREIWFIRRKRRIKGTDKYEYVPTYMVSRDGYLKAAKRDPDFEGLQSFVVREGDHFEVDAENFRVVHRFGAKRGKILGAWAIAYHRRRKPVICFVDFEEYNDPESSVWEKYPSAMIQKVAEVFVLRRQFDIAGLVAREELPEREVGEAVSAHAVPVEVGRAELPPLASDGGLCAGEDGVAAVGDSPAPPELAEAGVSGSEASDAEGWEYEGPPVGGAEEAAAGEAGAQDGSDAASVAPEPAPPPGPVRGQYRVLSAGRSAGAGSDVYSYVWAEPASGGKVALYGRGDAVLDVAALQEGDLIEAEGIAPQGRGDVLVATRVTLLGSLRRSADARKVDTVVVPEGAEDSLKVGRLGGREFVSRLCRDWQGDRRVLFALDGGPVEEVAGLEKGVRYRVRGYAWRDLIELVQLVGPVTGK